jgi:hypothetical protein
VQQNGFQQASARFRSGRFVGPAQLAAEAEGAFGGPVEVARDLDAFDF